MRSRNIKPGLFRNEILGAADPLLTLLFQGLWCIADREGRLEDRPLRIKAEIFPYREIPDIHGYLTQLERMGFIRRYEVNNGALIEVLNFKKHQSPHHTEKKSELPAPVNSPLGHGESPLSHGGNPPDSLIPDSLIPDSGGMLSHSSPPVNNSKPSQSKANGKSNGNSHSIESERTANLARAVANKLQVPDAPANLKSIERAIKNECLVSHCSELQAAEIITDHTHQASFGSKPIRFFFEDADWRNDPKYSSKSCNSKEMAGGG
jgi:hypothetical protein